MSWADEKFEAMFKAFSEEFDQSKWPAMCAEAEAYVAAQAPVIWMFTEPTLYASRTASPMRRGRTGGCI